MNVEVRLFATLADHAGVRAGSVLSVELPDGSALDTLLEAVGIPKNRVHLVIVDGHVTHDRSVPLRDGSRIGLFPPVGGG